MKEQDNSQSRKDQDTSSGLIRDVGSDPDSMRWNELVSLYRPMMVLWLRNITERHPSLRAELYDDVIQDTLICLAQKLPDFEYDREKGHFRGYLRKMLTNCAFKAARCDFANHRLVPVDMSADGVAEWPDARDEDSVSPEMVQTLWNILLERVFSDGNFSRQSQTVFRKLISGEAGVTELSETYNMAPNAIYQLKSRVIAAIKRRKRLLDRQCDTMLDYLEKMAGDDLL